MPDSEDRKVRLPYYVATLLRLVGVNLGHEVRWSHHRKPPADPDHRAGPPHPPDRTADCRA